MTWSPGCLFVELFQNIATVADLRIPVMSVNRQGGRAGLRVQLRMIVELERGAGVGAKYE